MAHASMMKVENARWDSVRATAPVELLSKFTEGELDSLVCLHQPGSEVSPQLFELKYLPNVLVPPHTHDENEIMYVLGGEMHIGAEVLRPGSSLTVPGGAIYSFAAGPDGLHILNFRPRTDLTFTTLAELRSQRRNSGSNPSPDATEPR